MPVNVDEKQIEYKKRVGKLKGSPVVEVGLKGGLHLIFVNEGGTWATLGAAPHRAIARHIAKKKSDNKIEWSDLSKADYIEESHYAHLLPRYEALTDALRECQGLK